MFRILIFSFCLQGLIAEASSRLIVWNVGQGQWVTHLTDHTCSHFDLGGEVSPLPQVERLCRDKFNFVQISHWDLDHVSFLKSFQKRIRKKCLIPPDTPPPTERKKALIEGFAACTRDQISAWHAMVSVLHRPQSAERGNLSSSVVFLKPMSVLIPGDSPLKSEKIWMHNAPNHSLGLLLGHHGSRTSTSEELLLKLPHLQWAVASARSTRYGHPHAEIRRRLTRLKVPLIKTEDWGHLHFEEAAK